MDSSARRWIDGMRVLDDIAMKLKVRRQYPRQYSGTRAMVTMATTGRSTKKVPILGNECYLPGQQVGQRESYFHNWTCHASIEGWRSIGKARRPEKLDNLRQKMVQMDEDEDGVRSQEYGLEATYGQNQPSPLRRELRVK